MKAAKDSDGELYDPAHQRDVQKDTPNPIRFGGRTPQVQWQRCRRRWNVWKAPMNVEDWVAGDFPESHRSFVEASVSVNVGQPGWCKRFAEDVGKPPVRRGLAVSGSG